MSYRPCFLRFSIPLLDRIHFCLFCLTSLSPPRPWVGARHKLPLHVVRAVPDRRCVFALGTTSTILVFSGVFASLVDAYPLHAASALATNSFARGLFAGPFPCSGPSEWCSGRPSPAESELQRGSRSPGTDVETNSVRPAWIPMSDVDASSTADGGDDALSVRLSSSCTLPLQDAGWR